MNAQKADEARWFAEEVLPHERDLRAYLSRYSRESDVDDVVQESFLQLLRARQTRSIANVRAYLFRVARNGVFMLFRRPDIFSSEAITDACALSVVEDRPGVAERVSMAEEVALLLDAIDTLPARCREIFVLRKLHGVSQKEIASRLGLSEQTVQVQVARGAKKCAMFFRFRR
jgi:RNA polymerase sigma factor (sigma-70 family)